MHFEECAGWNARVFVIGGEIWRSVGVATQALFGVGSKEFVSDDKLKSDVEKFQGSKQVSLRAEPMAETCRISERMDVVQAVNVSMLKSARARQVGPRKQRENDS